MSTVANKDIATWYWFSESIVANGQVGYDIPYSNFNEVQADKWVFPQRCILEEFRWQPIGVWESQMQEARLELLIDGQIFVQDLRQVGDVVGRMAVRLYRLPIINFPVGLDTVSPGAFIQLRVSADATVPTRRFEYQCQMWGTWIRS